MLFPKKEYIFAIPKDFSAKILWKFNPNKCMGCVRTTHAFISKFCAYLNIATPEDARGLNQ